MVQQRVVSTLNELEAAGIEYCVLRNYGFATGEPVAGDVDILVRESQRGEVFRVLQNLGYHPGEGDTTRQTTFKRLLPSQRETILLDVYWDAPTYNGLPILDGERTLANRRLYPKNRPREEQIYVPQEEEYFVELVFHGALNKNRYREFYRSELERLRTDVNRKEVLTHATALFGRIGQRAMNRALDGKYGDVVAAKWRLVRAGCRKRPSVIPRLVWNLLILREIVRPLQAMYERYAPGNPAPVIAIYGPDGAGKTTIATALQEALHEAGIDSHVDELGVYNGETRFLKTLKAVRNFVAGETRSNSAEKKKERPRTLVSRRTPLHAALHCFDIGLRTWRARSESAVVIADRYVHDILLYDAPGPVRRLFPWFERPPFFAVLLDGPPEEIAARSEYDTASVAEMYDRLDEVDLVTVDATKPPEVIVEEILSRLVDIGILPR